MSDVATVLASLDGIDGWLRPEQASVLYEAAAGLRQPATIVEIGSYRGRSTIALASAAAAGVALFAIDPHGGNDRGPSQWKGTVDEGEEDHRLFHDNLERAGVAGRVRHIRLRSQDALDDVDGPVDLLFVDGAHGYRPALADLTRWGDRVAPGGTMAVHDAYLSVGVTMALARLLFFGRRFRLDHRVRSLVVYRRRDLTGWARIANTARQLVPLGWFARNLAIRALLAARLVAVARALGYGGDGLA